MSTPEQTPLQAELVDAAPPPQPQSAQTTQQAVQALFQFAAGQMRAGVRSHEVERNLMARGLSAEGSHTIVVQLQDAFRKAAKKNMLVGVAWCVGGIVITAVTYQMAANNPGGGTYLVTWGPVIFGAIQFFRGLAEYFKH